MIRDLELLDIDDDYMELLCQLSGKNKQIKWQTAMAFWLKYEDNDDHQTFVFEHDNNIIGTSTVVVGNKLLHYGSRVGHIEDVVVDNESRLSGVGKRLINACLDFCKEKSCYKAILDCSEDNIPFYEACGFKHNENCMRFNFE